MSHRIREGIRRDEYRFANLPEVVQEKEAKRLYAKLTAPLIEQDHLNQIPEADRADFLRAYEAGNRKEAGQILNRDSFRRNVALETSSGGASHSIVNAGRKVDDHAALSHVMSKLENDARPAVESTAADKYDDLALNSLNLKGVMLGGSNFPSFIRSAAQRLWLTRKPPQLAISARLVDLKHVRQSRLQVLIAPCGLCRCRRSAQSF